MPGGVAGDPDPLRSAGLVQEHLCLASPGAPVPVLPAVVSYLQLEPDLGRHLLVFRLLPAAPVGVRWV